MQTTPYAQPITSINTVSSLGTNNIVNAATSVQSGPYTKAQCKLIFFSLLFEKFISIFI